MIFMFDRVYIEQQHAYLNLPGSEVAADPLKDKSPQDPWYPC
jgi:hypothetical protein